MSLRGVCLQLRPGKLHI